MPEGTVKKADHAKLKEAEKLYNSFLSYTRSLFSKYPDEKEAFNIISVSKQIKYVWNSLRNDLRFLIRVQHLAVHRDENYIASHSARSCIISIVIGMYLKLPNHRLIELGIAALFHDMGMLTLPPELYLSNRILTEQEKKLLYTHPVQSYRIVQSFNYPPSVCDAVIQHHERENGSGYPRNFKGKQISTYGKIIGVACSYDALSAKRHHKEAKDHHTGIVELLNNKEKQYDNACIRALVYSLSLYPIGLFVLLSNGNKGQVIDVNPQAPRFPVVQIFEKLYPGEKRRTVQTAENEIVIVRPLDRDEIFALDTSEPPPPLTSTDRPRFSDPFPQKPFISKRGH